MAEPLSVKATVPAGLPDPGATTLTVAVKVTGWPAFDGSAEEVSAVAVVALLTVRVAALVARLTLVLVKTARYWLPL
jgi:hypothetical protein